jgi:hypothetical protein
MKCLLIFFTSSVIALLHISIKAQNPIADFYGNGSYPIWTDNVHWANQINMQTFDFTSAGLSSPANEFQKFEFARDILYQQGGGVLYYPAGTYNFSEIPETISDGVAGRGLMLRSGVVIVGETPNNKNALNGTLEPKTKFIFKSKSIKDTNNKLRPIPTNWNFIGCMPTGSETLKDLTNIGILWVELQGGVVYFGAQYQFSTSYSSGGGWYNTKAAKGEWNLRIPDGTHPLDPFAAASGNYVGAGSGRIVMGCLIRNGVIGNHNIIQYAKEKYDTISQSTYPYKFGARIGIYGSNVLVANNYLPKPDSCFKYYQTTAITQQDKCNQAFGNHRSILIYDYGKSIGIDVNKGFLNPFNNTTSGYLSENIIVQDNNVYNHGNKGYELSGNWFLVKNNKNERDYLSEGANRYGLGSGWELTLDGFYESQPGGNGCLSDNLSRAFDMAGKNGWIDNNFYNNTGSNPGNDGEGILWQAHGGMNSILSFAITNNNGPSGYMAGYDVNQYGALWAWNTTTTIGNFKSGTMSDVAIVSNTGSIVYTGTDVLTTCPTNLPTASPAPIVKFNTNKTYVEISWLDASNYEIGFRVDRKDGSGEWKTIALRPRKSVGTVNNEQVWRDYMYPKNIDFSYRVVAIDCDNNNLGASMSSMVLNTITATKNKEIQSQNVFKLYADKVVFIDDEKNRKLTITDITGKIIDSGIISTGVYYTTKLKNGIYIFQIETQFDTRSIKIIKQ